MSRFSIPSKLPSLPSVPKVPDIKLPSTNILSRGILSSPPPDPPPANGDATEAGDGADDQSPDTDTPQKEHPGHKSVLKAGHTVYLVMQPVVAVSKFAADFSKIKTEIKSFIYRYLAGWIDFTTLLGLLVAQHWAVRIDDHYYHLKRLQDDSLGLDMSSFTEEAIFLKIPLWKTTLTHEESAGIAVRILAVMMGKSKESASVRVEKDGHVVSQDGFSFSKYRNYIYYPTTGKGIYNAALNNCQHFVRRFFNQVFIPNGPKDLLEWPSIARELWFSGLSKSTAQDILAAIKSNNLSVEYLLECLLKSGGGAATVDVSKSAAAAEEATAFARDAALSLRTSVTRLVELAEPPVPVTKEAAEMSLNRAAKEDAKKELKEGGEGGEGPTTPTVTADDATGPGSEKEQTVTTTTAYDPEKVKAKIALEMLNALEEEASEFAKLTTEFELRAKTAKVLVQAYLTSMDTASHFTEGVDSPK